MKLIDELLSFLGGKPAQTNRLVKLHTPLGADLLAAERLEAFEGIGPDADAQAGAGFKLVVHALSTDAHIELKQLIGQPVQVELLTSQSRTALRPWHGHVTSAAMVGSDGGLARYRLVVEPWFAFLAHRQDSWVFQGQTVQQIVDEVLADYQGQGTLVPAWRWDLADPSVYPQRSLCTQYQETDLAFVQRLLREEGLFYWFEHTGDAHTLVIADHNGAFKPNVQERIRYTQSSAVLPEDSLTDWDDEVHVRTGSVQMASLDYRSVDTRPVSQQGVDAPLPSLGIIDVPGVYAYEDSAQGERLALRQAQAIDARRAWVHGKGSVRSMAPGSLFTLLDHPTHDGTDEQRDRFVVLTVKHVARNNLAADAKAQVESLLGAIRRVHAPAQGLRNESDEPLYQCELVAQPASLAVRPVTLDESGQPDPRLCVRPTVHGLQTAIVVGLGEPVHTDRDHRIKVQFHWQRGGQSSHRLNPAVDDNAPGSDASGTWVRVAETVAGDNWGGHFVPRLGQEVVVSFLGGDIDRPVVLGSVYNGVGQANAQSNQVGGGAATSTGNANAWFPGDETRGALQAHQHAAVMAGFKSQELSASQSGAGGYNQLVFDDTPAAGRIELGTTSASTRLQLGHLIHQTDNQRLQQRGHGLDLSSAAWGAVRAGSGLLLSAHVRGGSQTSAHQVDAREPQASIEQAMGQVKTLWQSAQDHQAKLKDEAAPDKASVVVAMDAFAKALMENSSLNDDQGSGEGQIGGGAGTVTAWSRPDLVAAAPGGVASTTPASTLMSAGNTMSVVAGQDLQALAQANHATAVAKGLVLFTYGKAQDASKPNQEVGIKLHAASGSVNTQSQASATRLTADKSVEVSSATAMVKVAAPNHVLLTAAGAALRIEGGDITLNGPGKVEFKAAMKELTSAGSASASLRLATPAQMKGCAQRMSDALAQGSAFVER
jgi:type VI secretion system secreted protein VgrG